MPLNKSAGNMFPFVTHTWNPMAGECSHRCGYCYVEGLKSKPVLKSKYSGQPRIRYTEMDQNLGKERTIFVQTCGDLFAEDVDRKDIGMILKRCNDYPDNTYLFLTKNPIRYTQFIEQFPPSTILGTTIETDLPYTDTKVPPVESRLLAMLAVRYEAPLIPRFISFEPIMKFTLFGMRRYIDLIKPEFVAIGADSQKSGLDEPTRGELLSLINRIEERKIEVFQKKNLKRLLEE